MLRTAPRAMAFAILLGALSLGAPNAMAGTTGKLHGTVRGEKNEPLAGVNIRVEGQRPRSDDGRQGRIRLLGIPAGQYLIHANMLATPRTRPRTSRSLRTSPPSSTSR